MGKGKRGEEKQRAQRAGFAPLPPLDPPLDPKGLSLPKTSRYVSLLRSLRPSPPYPTYTLFKYNKPVKMKLAIVAALFS